MKVVLQLKKLVLFFAFMGSSSFQTITVTVQERYLALRK